MQFAEGVSILKKALRIISILIGMLSFVTAMRFAFGPARAADRLGMPWLEGVGAGIHGRSVAAGRVQRRGRRDTVGGRETYRETPRVDLQQRKG